MRRLEAIFLLNTNLRIIDIGSTFVTQGLKIPYSTGKRVGIDSHFIVTPFLSSSGYTCDRYSFWFYLCFPCGQGHYKIDAFYEHECQKCPPGGFYQDEISHIGEVVYGLGCKQCPAGSYVRPENTPGKIKESCSACLEGTNLKRLAGFRACPCLDNYYRLDRFGKCTECPLGYECTNETVNLLPEFYWIWKDEQIKEKYVEFSKKLQEENKDVNSSWQIFNGTLPKAYHCLFIGSCKGGMDNKCSDGYEGTLCATCSKGYYKVFSGCNKCPNVFVFMAQSLGIVILVAIIVFVIIKDNKAKRSNGRSTTDTIFSSLKIVIGFYQVTSGTLNAYSYIKWPEALTNLMKFTDVVQLNIFKLVPIECLRQSIRITPYSGLAIYISLDVMVILLAIGYFFMKKTYANTKDKNTKLSECKANCYRSVFMFLFVTYPATCEKVLQILPGNCHEVCDDQQNCSSFLRSDFSIMCFTNLYDIYVIFAFFALIIPIAFPIITVVLLWKYCRNIEAYCNDDPENDESKLKEIKRKYQKSGMREIAVGMRFMYENYNKESWYWEVIELIRKVILTSVLVYSGQKGRLFLGVTAIISGFYAILFAHSKPIPNLFENWLHLGSLIATMANQFMAMLLKIPAETVSTLVDTERDSIGLTVMLVFANVFVIVMIAIRYFYSVFLSLQVIRKNPSCSLTCVLSVFQVLVIGEGQELSSTTCKEHNQDQETVIGEGRYFSATRKEQNQEQVTDIDDEHGMSTTRSERIQAPAIIICE